MTNEDLKPIKKERELKRKQQDIVMEEKPKIKKEPAVWSDDEDELLREACLNTDLKDVDWKDLCNKLSNKSYTQALHRWQKVLDPKLIKGSWSQDEDDTLKQLVAKHGPKNWSVIASHLNGRIGKQCRERWYNHLAPEIRKDPWTPQEDRIILDFHAKFGNKWSDLAKLLPGRPSNAIKNHWNSTLRRRVQEAEEKNDNMSRTKKAKKSNDMYTEEFNEFLAIKNEVPPMQAWGSNSFDNLIDAPLVSLSSCDSSSPSSVSELFNNTFAQFENEIDEEFNNLMEDSERADYSSVMPNVINLNFSNPMMNPYFPMQQQFAMPMMQPIDPNIYFNAYGQIASPMVFNQFPIQNNFPMYTNQPARMMF